mmetsp:Transcript_4285/g.10888  ORF Transcript_4285/g.10888 Transcript_4285/m.10888 type:complete len:355 (+) Transcript_4285:1243-2307(+)
MRCLQGQCGYVRSCTGSQILNRSATAFRQRRARRRLPDAGLEWKAKVACRGAAGAAAPLRHVHALRRCKWAPRVASKAPPWRLPLGHGTGHLDDNLAARAGLVGRAHGIKPRAGDVERDLAATGDLHLERALLALEANLGAFERDAVLGQVHHDRDVVVLLPHGIAQLVQPGLGWLMALGLGLSPGLGWAWCAGARVDRFVVVFVVVLLVVAAAAAAVALAVLAVSAALGWRARGRSGLVHVHVVFGGLFGRRSARGRHRGAKALVESDKRLGLLEELVGLREQLIVDAVDQAAARLANGGVAVALHAVQLEKGLGEALAHQPDLGADLLREEVVVEGQAALAPGDPRARGPVH